MSQNPWLDNAAKNAKAIVNRPEVAARISTRAAKLASHYRGRLGDSFSDVQTMARLVAAWATGRYRAIPIRSIIALLGALIYFLVPLDAVPDFIVALGLLDDIAVIAKVVSLFRTDIQAFKRWEDASPVAAEQDRETEEKTEGEDDAE
ncbi:MAG: DUF1232 domain-containing protein [Gammaproteobacteria bacterium]|nr:DUF1232 domain-containing protein [Gammaproteobacteria bacterium]MBQ0774711.1 DUF1232 domain-containing protein [Gammaproteobacteria bacterium]